MRRAFGLKGKRMRKLQLETRICDSCGRESEPHEIGVSPEGWVTTEDAAIHVVVQNHTVMLGDVCEICAARPFIVAIQAFKELQLRRMDPGLTPTEAMNLKTGLAEIAALPKPPVAEEKRKSGDTDNPA
jgi:hypothetical protein